MTDIPDEIVLKVARDREGKRDIVFRRAFTGTQPETEPDHARGACRAGAPDRADHSLDEIEWAVLETGGQISFIPKQRA